MTEKNLYLAAGCFWGAQHFFRQLQGVTFTEVGFANGAGENPTYEAVYTDETGFAETVHLRYHPQQISMATLVRLFFRIIDPTSLNQQGEDVGTRYRTGIYYDAPEDEAPLREAYLRLVKTYSKPVCVELLPLQNFYPAENYHQNYLEKNPDGYCHLSFELFAMAKSYRPVSQRIREELFTRQDVVYRDFQAKLMPGISKERIIGVRTPDVRALAKTFARDLEIDDFLAELPHNFYDEYQLHGFILNQMKPFEVCLEQVNRLLPHINNWATCDQLRPKIFAKHLPELLNEIPRWLSSNHTYTIRFGIEMLMSFYLDDAFEPRFLEWVSSVCSDEYYVKMMIAWYFATALAKQYDATLPFIEQHRLEPWTHNKTIQKAIESFRISDEQKQELKKWKI